MFIHKKILNINIKSMDKILLGILFKNKQKKITSYLLILNELITRKYKSDKIRHVKVKTKQKKMTKNY